MLISVYMNDKASFDGFWNYWKAHCAAGSGDTCLMTWRIGGAGGSAARRPTPTKTPRSRC